MQYVLAYIFTAIVFFAIDMLWLGKIAKSFYFSNLGHLLAKSMNFTYVGIFYVFYIAGIVFFATRPAMQDGQISTALLYGALFGFFCYGTYEFTNLATLKDWPVKVLIVDIIWGTVLTGSSAAIGFYLMQKLSG